MSSCQTNTLKEKKNKIRKRGCSSSSSSSIPRRYPIKRAILVGKNRIRSSPSMATHHHHFTKAVLPSSGFGVPSKEKELSVSARKLAATLWEFNDMPPSRGIKEPIRNRDKSLRLYTSGLFQPHVSDSDPSHDHFSEEMKGFEIESSRRRVSHQLKLADYYTGGLDARFSANSMEKVGNHLRSKKNCGKCAVGIKNRLKEARNGLSTSKKLLKVLNQMCHQEQHSSSIPLILAMSTELDRVRNQIDQLIQEHGSNTNDIEYLVKHFAEEKTAWKRREREKIRDATKSIVEELEVERKLRKQTESLNKKIAKEMSNVKASYFKVLEDLEREKRAKEILQQVCDELATGIGEDKAQVEELRRVREEVEKEREMLQLADVLREERVHMKLSEAKYHFEEKNAVLEKLRNELESFFRSKEEENGDVNPELKKLKDIELSLNKTCWEFQNLEEENGLNVGHGLEVGDDSADSDLQSIELNMDNDNRSYKWSYACENVAKDDVKRVSIDKDTGRKSFSERFQWGSICFNKGNPSGKKRDLGANIQERSIESLFGSQIQEHNEAKESFGNLKYVDGEAEENALGLWH